MSLQEIRDKLRGCNIAAVARETGLHYNTVLAVRDSDLCNPTFRTIQALTEYLSR